MSRAGQVRSGFKAIIKKHRALLHKVVNTYCFDPEDQRDLMQDIVAALWHAYGRYDPERRLSTWMYRIALNVAISHVRSQVRHRRRWSPLPDGVESIADANVPDPERDEQVRMLHDFITTLEPLNRALLVLYLEECSAREIAEVLGISESNVTTRIHRLKQRIRVHMAPHGQD